MDDIVFSYTYTTTIAAKHLQCNVEVNTYASKFT